MSVAEARLVAVGSAPPMPTRRGCPSDFQRRTRSTRIPGGLDRADGVGVSRRAKISLVGLGGGKGASSIFRATTPSATVAGFGLGVGVAAARAGGGAPEVGARGPEQAASKANTTHARQQHAPARCVRYGVEPSAARRRDKQQQADDDGCQRRHEYGGRRDVLGAFDQRVVARARPGRTWPRAPC